MTNDIFVVQVLQEDNNVLTEIITSNVAKAVEWCKFYTDECLYPQSWIVQLDFTEINFYFASLQKAPCKYLRTKDKVIFNHL